MSILSVLRINDDTNLFSESHLNWKPSHFLVHLRSAADEYLSGGSLWPGIWISILVSSSCRKLPTSSLGSTVRMRRRLQARLTSAGLFQGVQKPPRTRTGCCQLGVRCQVSQEMLARLRSEKWTHPSRCSPLRGPRSALPSGTPGASANLWPWQLTGLVAYRPSQSLGNTQGVSYRLLGPLFPPPLHWSVYHGFDINCMQSPGPHYRETGSITRLLSKTLAQH